MRLTDQETSEAVGINPVKRVFTECIQASPCLLELRADREFYCSAHQALFLPALVRGSALWRRVQEGLQLFGVPPENLTAVTGFRLDMVQRPRFTAQLYPRAATAPGTFGCLLGDAANAIHFWPGRGLNSGLASVISLARCLCTSWRGTALRDADFLRHEAVMAMLQYRHKSRAWRQMVTTDAEGTCGRSRTRSRSASPKPSRAPTTRKRTRRRSWSAWARSGTGWNAALAGLPDDLTLRAHLARIPGPTLHTLLVSEPWDTGSVSGEEVDVEWLLELT